MRITKTKNNIIFLIRAGMILMAFFFPTVCLAAGQEGSLEGAVYEDNLDHEYRVAPEDILEVSVYDEPELIRQLVVCPDGRISFPLVGDIKVAGKTTAEIKAVVEKKIQVFVPNASVTVIIMELKSLKFYVLGKVARPGMFNVSNRVTVLQALAMAGGPTPFAKTKKISISRKVGANTHHISVDYENILKGQYMEQNYTLERGDVVLVP